MWSGTRSFYPLLSQRSRSLPVMIIVFACLIRDRKTLSAKLEMSIAILAQVVILRDCALSHMASPTSSLDPPRSRAVWCPRPCRLGGSCPCLRRGCCLFGHSYGEVAAASLLERQGAEPAMEAGETTQHIAEHTKKQVVQASPTGQLVHWIQELILDLPDSLVAIHARHAPSAGDPWRLLQTTMDLFSGGL